MPIFVAIFVYAGSFFGVSGHDWIPGEMKEANRIQQEWLAQKRANIEIVRKETMRVGLISRAI